MTAPNQQQQTQSQISTIPGLVGGGVRTQGSNAVIDGVTKAQYQTVDGVYRTVQSNETVQGQLQGILASNSPLMAQARAKALENMQERGLVNSAMAETAGQSAVIDKSLQIATPDAATYAMAARDNQQVGNETNRFNAGGFNSNQQFNAGEGNKLNLQKTADTAAMGRVQVQEAGATQRVGMQEAGALQRTNIQEAGALNRTNIQAQASMAVADMNRDGMIQSATLSANGQMESARIGAAANYAITEMTRDYTREVNQTALGAGMISDFAKTAVAIQIDPNLDLASRQRLLGQMQQTTNMGLQFINSTQRIADTSASASGSTPRVPKWDPATRTYT